MLRFLILAINIFFVNSAPVDYQPISFMPLRVMYSNDRFAWNFLGDLVSNSGFLPVELNVPDTVGAVYGGAQNLAQGLSNLAQRIPWISRLTSPETPRRPLRLQLLVDQQGQLVVAAPLI